MANYYCYKCGQRLANMYANGHTCLKELYSEEELNELREQFSGRAFVSLSPTEIEMIWNVIERYAIKLSPNGKECKKWTAIFKKLSTIKMLEQTNIK